MSSAGINTTIDDFNYRFFDARLYTRVRSDISSDTGTTPTKLKLSVNEAFNTLERGPHNHIFTDIPYSICSTIKSTMIGKPVWDSHDANNGQVGYVAQANLTDCVDHVAQPSNDPADVYNGIPVKNYTLMGRLALKKLALANLTKKYHVLNNNDFDVSVSYYWNFDMDKEDTHFNKDGYLDYDKSLVYITDFAFRELSICNHGHGACKGARILHECSNDKKSESSSKWIPELIKLLSVRVSSFSTDVEQTKKSEIFKKTINDMSKLFKRWTFTFISKCVEKKNIGKKKNFFNINKKKKYILEIKNNNNNKENQTYDFLKNHQFFNMSTNTENKQVNQQTQNNTQNVQKEQQLQQNTIAQPQQHQNTTAQLPTQQNTTQQPNNSVKNDAMDTTNDFTLWLTKNFGITKKEDFMAYGEQSLNFVYEEDKKYRANAEKSFPDFKKKLTNVMKIVKSDNNFEIPEDTLKVSSEINKLPANKGYVKLVGDMIDFMEKGMVKNSDVQNTFQTGKVDTKLPEQQQQQQQTQNTQQQSAYMPSMQSIGFTGKEKIITSYEVMPNFNYSKSVGMDDKKKSEGVRMILDNLYSEYSVDGTAILKALKNSSKKIMIK